MGEPTGGNAPVPTPEHIGREEASGGTETSKYPEEKKETFDSLSSGERTGSSPNRTPSGVRGCGPAIEHLFYLAEPAGKPDHSG